MEEIKAFGKALEALLKLFAMALRSALNHGEIAWEDFTDFLEDNGWSVKKLINVVMLYFVTVSIGGFAIAFVGLCLGSLPTLADWQMAYLSVGLGIGTFLVLKYFFKLMGTLSASIGFIVALFSGTVIGFGGFTIAQALVMIGMLVTLIGLIPIVLMYLLARRFYNLLFNTGTFCVKFFKGGESKNVPVELRWQLEALKGAGSTPFEIMLAVYLLVYMVMYWNPTLSSIPYVLMAGSFGFITYFMRKSLQIKGWMVKHFIFASTMAAFWGAAPAYFVAGWVNKQPRMVGVYPDSYVAFYFQIGSALLIGLMVFTVLYRNTHSVTSDEALVIGDVKHEEYTKVPVGIDEHGHVQWGLKVSQPLNLSWLKPVMIIGLLVGGWFLMGKPNPISAFDDMDPGDILLYFTVAAVVIFVVGFLFTTFGSAEAAQIIKPEIHKEKKSES